MEHELFIPEPNTHHQSREHKTRDFRHKSRGRAHRVVSPIPRTNGKINTCILKGLVYGKTSRFMQRERQLWVNEAIEALQPEQPEVAIPIHVGWVDTDWRSYRDHKQQIYI